MSKKKISNVVRDLQFPSTLAEAFGAIAADDPGMTVAVALERCGLDWETRLRGVCVADKMRTKIPGFNATYRSDTDAPLGLVRSRYKPMHNFQAFEWFDVVVRSSKNGASLAFGGLLRNGVKTFMGLHFTEAKTVSTRPTEAIVMPIMVAINSNDASTNYTVHLFAYRPETGTILCLHAPTNGYKVRHTSDAPIKMAELSNIVKEADQHFKKFVAQLKQMAKTKVSDDDVDRLIYRALGVPKKEIEMWLSGKIEKAPQWVNQQKAVAALMENTLKAVAPGTLYQVYAALTDYFDHVRNVRGQSQKADVVTESKLTGYSAKMKHQSLVACLAYLPKEE